MAKQKTSRKAFATTAAAVMAATAVTPVAAFAASTTSFPDVPAGEYADAINNLAGKGILNGFDDGTFKPNDPVLREQAAKILATALKLDTTGTENYPDVSPDNWSYKYIVAVTKAGIFGGDESGKFNPFDNLTRQEAAKIIVKAFGFKGSSELTFGDKANIQSWAVPYVKTAVANGILKGDDQGNFNPNANIKRGDFALMIQRALNAVENAKTPKVESVSAINAKQIEIKFNTAMDKDSVTDVTKYSIKRAGVASVALTNNSTATDATASLSEDGKTLTITLDNALTSATWGSIAEGDTFNLEHSKLKAVNGKEIAASSLSVKYSDKVAPNLVSATAKAATSTKTVTLKFSEPVDFTTTGVFKVNGQVATPSAGSDVREVVLTTSQNLTAGQTYTVEVTNLKDLAGNLITPNPVSLDFTVVQDNTADGIESVTVQGDNKVKVVFKESMNSSTVTTAGNIKLVDANGNPITNVTVSTGANSKEYTINVGSGTNLYANADTNTVNIIFTNAIKDATGNAITPETRTVTFTKDKVAPKVSKVQLIAPGDTYDGLPYPNGALLLTFDEKVVRPADGGTPGDLALSKIQVIDQDGTDVTSNLFGAGPNISSTVLDSNDNAKLVIPFTTAPDSTVKTATVRLVASAVTDASLGTNGNAAATVTGVDFTTSVADTQKPVISAASVAGGAGNTIKFIVTEANLDKATVLDINNYRLDGTPLPAGSYVTISTAGSTHTVTVHLPAGSISKTRTNYAFTISGIKDKAGNTADVVAVNNVSLTDDVQPVLTAGKLNADGTITLTYSEAVTGAVAGDFVVTLNGKTVATTAVTPTDIASGADAGGTLLTIATAFHDQDGTAGNGDEIIYVDAAGGSAGTYDAGDIVIASGTFANLAAYGTSVKASDVVTLKVATAATGALTGKDADNNTLANGKSVTIK